MPPFHLYTIGFTQKSAERFFTLLKENSVTVLVDIRLHPDSQLSGFAKKRDLPYLLSHLIDCSYEHRLEMAPTEELLSAYRRDKSWESYARGFNRLLEERQLIEQLEQRQWQSRRACLLCSEHEPDFCHRRLVADYLQHYWKDIEIFHLM